MAEKTRKTEHKKLIRLLSQFCAATVLFVADLWIKTAVKGSSLTEKPLELIPGVFSLQFTKNTGAAWGMFRDKPQLLSVFVGAALLLIAVYACFSKGGAVQNVCLTMIFAGGAANLADRVMNGYVTAYLSADFISFPVFNFADCLIVVGCIVLMIRLIYEAVRDSRGKRPAEKTNG